MFKRKFIDLIRPIIQRAVFIKEDGTDIVKIIESFITMGQMVYSTRIESREDQDEDVYGTVDALDPSGLLPPGETIIDDCSTLLKKLFYMKLLIRDQIQVHFSEEVISQASSGSYCYAWPVFDGFEMWIAMNKEFTVLPLEKELVLIKNFLDGYKTMHPKELKIKAEALSCLVPTMAPLMKYLFLINEAK